MSSSITQKLEDMAITVTVPVEKTGRKPMGITYTLVKLLLWARAKKKNARPSFGSDTSETREEVGSSIAVASDEAFQQKQTSLTHEEQLGKERNSLPSEVQHSKATLKVSDQFYCIFLFKKLFVLLEF